VGGEKKKSRLALKRVKDRKKKGDEGSEKKRGFSRGEGGLGGEKKKKPTGKTR